jgi:hypothetical protein
MTSLPFESIGTISDSVRAVETDDGAVLLDIQQGLCLSLTPIAATIWRHLKLDHSLEEITDILAEEFGNPPRNVIQQDVVRFIADLRNRRLVLTMREQPAKTGASPIFVALLQPRRGAEGNASTSPLRAPRFLFWKALLGLLVFDLFRFGSNFSKIHTCVKLWPTTHRSAPSDLVERICRAMNYASMYYPKRVLCLQRSAVTTCMLRNCGIPAQMAVGARKFPFKAHAWTEVNGGAINERRDVQQIYLVWERF